VRPEKQDHGLSLQLGNRYRLCPNVLAHFDRGCRLALQAQQVDVFLNPRPDRSVMPPLQFLVQEQHRFGPCVSRCQRMSLHLDGSSESQGQFRLGIERPLLQLLERQLSRFSGVLFRLVPRLRRLRSATQPRERQNHLRRYPFRFLIRLDQAFALSKVLCVDGSSHFAHKLSPRDRRRQKPDQERN
jgi:hypothetical protein